MRSFFVLLNMLNRWQVFLAALLLIGSIVAGIFFFVFLPHSTAPPAVSLLEQPKLAPLTMPPPENTAPEKTAPEKSIPEKTAPEETAPEAGVVPPMAEEQWSEGPVRGQSHGSWVSEGARQGWVDGGTVSQQAHERNEQRRAGRAAGTTTPAPVAEPAAEEPTVSEPITEPHGNGNGKGNAKNGK